MLFFHDILTIYTICHISVGNGTATSIENGIGTIWILFGKTYLHICIDEMEVRRLLNVIINNNLHPLPFIQIALNRL